MGGETSVTEQVQVILINYFVKAFFAGKLLFEVVLRFVGPIFVVLAASLISFAVYVHFVCVLPWYNEGPVFTFSISSLIHALMSAWFCVGIAWNYYKCVTVRPPIIEHSLSSAEIAALAASSDSQAKGQSRFCKTCQNPKLDRMHHCHVCKMCIPGMDHHCPWIGNCVGSHNHHFFLLFLLYLFSGCTYAASMSFLPFLKASDTMLPWNGTVSRSAVIFSFVLATAVALALLMLMSWQFYLILTGQNSIEFYINQANTELARELGRTYRNPHDHGIQKNFQTFFGVDNNRYWFAWLVPGMCNPQHSWKLSLPTANMV